MSEKNQTPKINTLLSKFQKLETQLNSRILEREDEIHGVTLAVLSRQHIFLLGVPGTGKSFLIDEFHKAVQGSQFFQRLLTRFSQPDEIFGTVKLSKLKQDIYERNITGKLPTSHFAFIDEIFKANSSILNSILKILNERVYENDGSVIQCPLITMLCASNELPEERNELSALYDRIALRYVVEPLNDSSNFLTLLTGGLGAVTETLTLDEIKQAQSEVEQVTLTREIAEELFKLRQRLIHEQIEPSDRRFLWATKILKANAWYNGRDIVNHDDLLVLKHVLWDTESQVEVVNKIVSEISNPLLREAEDWVDAVKSAKRTVENAEEKDRLLVASEQMANVNKAFQKLIGIREMLTTQGRETTMIDRYLEECESVRGYITGLFSLTAKGE